MLQGYAQHYRLIAAVNINHVNRKYMYFAPQTLLHEYDEYSV